tara:strand:- start:20679 stop:21548 length:870 start_codon:yes stop_codon:yes gene_type:complete
MIHRILSIVVALFLLHLSFVQADQSILLEWSKNDTYYEGQNRNYFYKPKTTSLYYSSGLNESWSLGASLWQSESSERFDSDQIRLEENASGAAININYQKEDWSVNLGLSVSETDLDIGSLVLPIFSEEQGKNRDINLSVDYFLSFERLDIVPTLGLGSQKFKQVSTGSIPPFIFSRDDEQTSSYVFADLVLSTWFEISQFSLLQPSIQLGWTEVLSGQSSITTRIVSSKGRPLRPNSSASNDNTDGSGYIGLSLSLLIDDFQLGFSHSKTLALDINSDTSAVEFGVLF